MIGPRVIDTRKRSDQVRDCILDLIRNGTIKPGDRLPTEQEMTTLFGVGRSSVRAAVQSLIGLGIIEMRPGRGAYVKRLSVDDVTRVVAGALHLLPSATLQLLEAREMVEITAARLAAERHTEEDLAAMREALERSRKAFQNNDRDAMVDADIDFHAAMVRATHNEVLVTMLNSISGFLRKDRFAWYDIFENRAIGMAQHERIYAAIAAGNAKKAAALAGQHLALVRRQIESHMGKEVMQSASANT